MPRFLLVRCEKGTLVANPHTADRRYIGKPLPGPVWRPDEKPVDEVVQDDAGIRKAIRKPQTGAPALVLLGECIADNLMAARAALTPAAKSAPAKTEK